MADQEKRDTATPSSGDPIDRRKVVMLSLGLVALLLGIAVYLYFSSGGDGTEVSETGDSGTSFVFPVWIAVLPAIIASRKKKGEDVPKAEQTLLIIIGVGVTLLALGGLVVFLMNM